MGEELLGPRGSKLAGADLSAKQFCFVKLSTTADDTVLLCGAGQLAYGILQDNPLSGVAGNVQSEYESKVIYAGTIAAGDLLSSDASGHAVGVASGDYILAQAVVAGASGDIGRVKIMAKGAKAP